MVKITRTNLSCDSCSRNERDDGIKVFMITLGESSKQTTSHKLCTSCFDELNLKITEATAV